MQNASLSSKILQKKWKGEMSAANSAQSTDSEVFSKVLMFSSVKSKDEPYFIFQCGYPVEITPQ